MEKRLLRFDEMRAIRLVRRPTAAKARFGISPKACYELDGVDAVPKVVINYGERGV